MRKKNHDHPGKHPKSNHGLHAKPFSTGKAAPKGKYLGKQRSRPAAPSQGNVHEGTKLSAAKP